MVAAYRLLVARLEQHGEPYPLHLGVTEAGGELDGRIKGSAGIGALLEDGIGDTIRVSLSEDPVHEIPVAKALAKRYQPPPSSPTDSSGRRLNTSTPIPSPVVPLKSSASLETYPLAAVKRRWC